MEYYVISGKSDKQIGTGVLCRINNDLCEIYDYVPGSIPDWSTSNYYKRIITTNSSDYNIRQLNEIEFKEVVKYINRCADEDIETAIIKEELDSKSRKHYVTYARGAKYVDGYYTEDDFDTTEMLHREDFKYYYDDENKTLHKRSLDTNNFYEFVVRQRDGKFIKDWIITDSYRNLVEIINYNNIIMFIEQLFADVKNGKYDVNIEVSDLV